MPRYDAKKDSVRSPKYILDWVRRTFGKFHDPVPYNPKWDPATHADALKTEWKKLSYVNPPFSKGYLFLKKACLEWKKGKTVILLIKLDTLGRKNFSACKGAEIVFFRKPVIFPPHERAPRFGVCLLIFRANKTSTKYSFF